MNLLGDGASWLFGALKQSASATVTLRRSGYSDTTGVKAAIGTTQATTEQDGTIGTTYKSRDFLIAVADYAFASVAVVPAAGDLIIEADGSQCEVLPFADEPHQRWADIHNRTTYRIHTKQSN